MVGIIDIRTVDNCLYSFYIYAPIQLVHMMHIVKMKFSFFTITLCCFIKGTEVEEKIFMELRERLPLVSSQPATSSGDTLVGLCMVISHFVHYHYPPPPLPPHTHTHVHTLTTGIRALILVQLYLVLYEE